MVCTTFACMYIASIERVNWVKIIKEMSRLLRSLSKKELTINYCYFFIYQHNEAFLLNGTKINKISKE